jgi:glycerate 2-kinase
MADLKQLARRIFQETLVAIDIPAAMHRKLRREGSLLDCGDSVIDLSSYDQIFVVAIGKAAHAMVEGLNSVLPPSVRLEGIISAPTAPQKPTAGMKYFVAGHPVPDVQSWKAAEAILALLKRCDERTLVFFLLSGGGSALVELPLDPHTTLEDVQQIYRALVTCGAPIHEINTVRKHLSAVKGGRLTTRAGRATKVTLAISDVPLDCEMDIASGPTLPDFSAIPYVGQIIEKYELQKKFPTAVRSWIDDGQMPETPKGEEAAFRNARFVLLLGMDDLFHPAHHAAEKAGCISCCDNSTDDWPVKVAAQFLLEQLDNLRKENPERRVALIADGEVSSPVTGNGVGGRNSAFVLECVGKIAGRPIAVLSAGTDGIDGNSPAAGAVADGESLARAQAAGLDPRDAFQRSDAYSFFARLEDAVVTGPTGNNLRDLRILIAEP